MTDGHWQNPKKHSLKEMTMDYATEAANIVPPTRYPHTLARLQAPDSSDSASDTEPQSSSVQSSSQQHSIAPTLVVISSDEDTGNQSVASRTRSQRARQRTSSTAPLIEITTPPRHLNSQMTILWLTYKADNERLKNN